MREPRAALVAAAVVAGLLLAPASARAEDEVDPRALEAERLAGAAHAAYERGAYGDALDLYLQASKVQPAAILLFDIAVLYDAHLGAPAIARDYYGRALAAPDLERSLAERAKARMAEIEGPRAPKAPARDVAERKAAPHAGWHPLRIAGVAAGAAGLLSLGATGVLAVVAKNKDAEAAGYCDGDRCTDARAIALTDDAKGLASVADVTFVAGAALVTAGVVLWLVAPSRAPKPASLGPRGAALGWAW